MADLKFELELAAAAARARKAQNPDMDVVATTKDGGRVYRMSNGSLGFTSSGYATTDQDAVRRIMEGATPRSEVQRGFDNQRIAANPVAARAQEVVNGVPFVGEWADEAVGMVSPQAGQNMRAMSDAMERQKPMESLGAQRWRWDCRFGSYRGSRTSGHYRSAGCKPETCCAAAGAGRAAGTIEGGLSGDGA